MNNEQDMNIRNFVDNVIYHVNKDTGFCAAMRRADNPNQCSAAWEYLVPYCNLSVDRQRLAFALIGAAIARGKPEKDGVMSIGTALRFICQGDQKAIEREAKRLRRLIGCSTVQELVPVLRPILGYIQSKGAPVSYFRLLKDLNDWEEWNDWKERSETIRIRWTKDFYGIGGTAEEKPAKEEVKQA